MTEEAKVLSEEDYFLIGIRLQVYQGEDIASNSAKQMLDIIQAEKKRADKAEARLLGAVERAEGAEMKAYQLKVGEE